MSRTAERFWDVIIIGAGAAGLAAAAEAARSNLKVLVLEARDRVGGRVLTHRTSGASLPVELGAEFVHGKPPELWQIITTFRLPTYDVPDHHDYSLKTSASKKEHSCEIARMPHFWEDLQLVLRHARHRPGPDQSFERFLASARRDPELRRFLPLVQSYVEGFHGADPRFLSEKVLTQMEEELSEPHQRQAFRLSHGFNQVIDLLAENARNGGTEIRLNTVVREVHWRHHHVEVNANSRAGFELPRIRGRKLLLTVPLSLLQASAHENLLEGALHFVPGLEEKKISLNHLRMGPVTKVMLLFRERFWETEKSEAHFSTRYFQDFQDLSFLHRAPEADVSLPTWWTQLPFRTPLLTGWAGGPKALGLGDKGEEALLDDAIRSVSICFAYPRSLIESQLDAWFYHNWQADPYARGAYSYVSVHGSDAQRELARPMQDTLFFAGEATHYGGQSGTVDGAIATGIRAAREAAQNFLAEADAA